MRYVYSLDQGKFVTQAGVNTELTSARIQRSESEVVEIQFVRNGEPVQLDGAEEAECGYALKPLNKFDAAPVAAVDPEGFTWIEDEQLYRGDLNLMTEGLNELFKINESDTDDVALVTLMAGFGFRSGSSAKWHSTKTIRTEVANNVYRAGEEPPEDASESWLDGKAVRFDKEQDLSGEEREQARENINAASAEDLDAKQDQSDGLDILGDPEKVQVTHATDETVIEPAADKKLTLKKVEIGANSEYKGVAIGNMFIASASVWNAKQAALTAGTGVSLAGNVVSIGQSVATTADVTFNSITLPDVGTGAIKSSGNLKAFTAGLEWWSSNNFGLICTKTGGGTMQFGITGSSDSNDFQFFTFGGTMIFDAAGNASIQLKSNSVYTAGTHRFGSNVLPSHTAHDAHCEGYTEASSATSSNNIFRGVLTRAGGLSVGATQLHEACFESAAGTMRPVIAWGSRLVDATANSERGTFVIRDVATGEDLLEIGNGVFKVNLDIVKADRASASIGDLFFDGAGEELKIRRS